MIKIHPHTIQNGRLNKDQTAKLRKHSIFIALPAYGGMMLAPCAKSIMDFKTIITNAGGRCEFQPLINESLIPRGRNALVTLFQDTDYEYLMFIDSDIFFKPEQLVEMYLAAIYQKQPLVGGSYPKKHFNWAGIRKAVESGKLPDHQIEHCSGDHCIRFLQDKQELVYLDINEVKYLPTGFMLIHGSLFDKMKSSTTGYRLNTIPNMNHKLCRDYFAMPIDLGNTGNEIDNELLSEDYDFCAKARKLDIKVMYAPWVELWHYGTYAFRGCNFCSSGNIIHTFETQK